MTTGQTEAGAVVPSGHLLAFCIRTENIADITEAQLPSRWHPLRRAFMWGRVCCLREQAANIRDIVRERSANAGAVPRRGSDVGTSPLLGQKSEGSCKSC